MSFLTSCFSRNDNDDDNGGVRYNPHNPFRNRNRNQDGSSKLKGKGKEKEKEKEKEKGISASASSTNKTTQEMTEIGKLDPKKLNGNNPNANANVNAAADDDDDDDDDTASVAPPKPPVVKKRPPKNPPWKVKKVKIYDGMIVVGTVKVLHFKKKKCPALCNVLSTITRDPKFYEEEPEARVPMLLGFLDQMRPQAAYNKDLEPLVDFLEWEYEEEVAILEAMIANGEITFDGLWYLFKTGSRFIAKEYDEPVGALVATRYYEHSTFGSVFKITGNHITTNGRQLTTINGMYPIFQFSGLRDINALRVRPMKDEEYNYLHSRGMIFRDIALGPHYKYYTGNMLYSSNWSTEKFKASGRVMIDPANFSRFNPDYKGNFFVHATAANLNPNNGLQSPRGDDDGEDNSALKEIPDKQIFTCVPTIAGFSLTVKRWGQLHVKDIANIKFDSNAYDSLVMDEDRKQLVKSLVENSSQSFTDVISGKGGGCVFCLHGPPGTGKTLTAEAIADLLERPLYSVTVGELGVTTKDLETKLRQILELAWEWDAVLLIDEADIFLEQRTNHDIKRNAMVGIFLRLLEYHQGVLFLTSNRVKSFDEAFHSRISVALHYEALDQARRKMVFLNLLKAANVRVINNNGNNNNNNNNDNNGNNNVISLSQSELETLSEPSLNGRQIKSCIRLAQALAFSQAQPLSFHHLHATLLIVSNFQKDLQSGVLDDEPCNHN